MAWKGAKIEGNFEKSKEVATALQNEGRWNLAPTNAGLEPDGLGSPPSVAFTSSVTLDKFCPLSVSHVHHL